MHLPITKIRMLGAGAFGDVWLAVRDGKHVAVKYLRRLTRGDFKRFAREGRMLWQQLRNPHVVDLIDHDLEADEPCLVMEYCAGGSLRSWLDATPSPTINDVRTVVLQAARGIAGVHAVGGFHRDIKPENLLLARAKHRGLSVKVGDFGLARAPASGSLMTRSPCGTPAYMAPEILAGGAYHAGADVYSLGIVGIEMVTGQRAAASLGPARAPAQLKSLLSRMVAQDPRGRPDIKEVQAKLEDFSQRKAVEPAPEPDTGPGVGWLLAGAAAIAWLSQKNSRWDSSARRYRDRKGQFRSG